ncbi:MAG: serine--tRNA ligase [Fibromonadaceae bacterium]|jgi:seryl-tRNA synthetase|nr:serine--tRNA ligase [Fibromonadaceae bacterium]
MLDIKKIRENPELYRLETEKRNSGISIDEVLELDIKRRELIAETEKLKAQRNAASKKIGELKKIGQNADSAVEEMRLVGDKIAELDSKIRLIDEEQKDKLLRIPNVAHSATPEGKSSEDNVVVRSWGEPRQMDFNALDHKALGEKLKIFDFERGAKISGSGFPVYKGLGARLERALIQWFLDSHRERFGFEEIIPPYLVTRQSMIGTGQLPKFEEDMYACDKGDDLFLIPTAEVPLTNLYADEIIPETDLPLKFCAYSACFRREAGSYGKDTRGLLRLHQFNKVEMVYFSHPEKSYENHEELLAFAETLLQELGLPHRIIALCKGDLGFAAAKCYDLEVFAPVEEKWLEVSSVSNFEDYQARRANIRTKINGKNTFVHTLNGSGLATPRIMVAICDHYQQADASLVIPEVLRPYMGGLERIE